MLSDGELGTGGGGICWDDDRRARTWGEGGTELRSGMVRAETVAGEIAPTDPEREASLGRIALWLDAEDLR